MRRAPWPSAEDMGQSSFPASDPPATWTWDPPPAREPDEPPAADPAPASQARPAGAGPDPAR